MRGITLVAVAAVAVSHASDGFAGDTAAIFDELRFGESTSIQSGDSGESGLFPEVTIFLDPLDQAGAADWKQALVRPRVSLGTSIGTGDHATQVHAGVSWTVDFTDKLFAEAGFGGLWHNGNLENNQDGLNLGCRFLFREYVGLGYRFDDNWNVIGQVAHASHAKLCDGSNDGMTRAGIQVGYRF